jgi:predicted HTH domain antitoxin
MKTLSIEYPDTLPDVVRLSDADFQNEARMAMSVKLFELGKLTSGQAAQLAGVPRATFLYMLSSYGVEAVAWDLGESQQEFINA